MPQHKVLRAGRNFTNMLRVRGREVRTRMYIKESLSHADDSEEEGEEDHVEGGREAESREEDEEEVSTLNAPARALAGRGGDGLTLRPGATGSVGRQTHRREAMVPWDRASAVFLCGYRSGSRRREPASRSGGAAFAAVPEWDVYGRLCALRREIGSLFCERSPRDRTVVNVAP